MTNEAARFTGSIPENYDRGLGPAIFADFAEITAQAAASHAPARVLEIAAGTGIVTRRLRDRLPVGARLTATDLNPPMLDVARAKFGPHDAVEFQTADATALPFGDGSFDAAVCQFGLMFFPDRARSFAEVHRVLAQGGRYHLSTWDSHEFNPYGRIAHETIGGFFPQDPPQFYTVPYSCAAIDPIKQGLAAAGFRDIFVSVITQEKEVPDLAGFARGLVFGNPTIDQIRSRGNVDPEQVYATMLARLREEFGDPARLRLQAIFFEAKKE